MTDPSSEPTDVAPLLTDDQRESAVRRLSTAFAADALAVEEFERRVAAVYRATSGQALVDLVRDLPDPAAPSTVPAESTSKAVGPPRGRRRITSVFSSVERRISGPMPRRLHIRSICGNVELDLRDAEFGPGVTEIRVRAFWGNIELELPEGIEVDNDGRALMGRFAVQREGRSRGPSGEAPRVRITGRSIMGNVEIEVGD